MLELYVLSITFLLRFYALTRDRCSSASFSLIFCADVQFDEPGRVVIDDWKIRSRDVELWRRLIVDLFGDCKSF